MVSHKGTAYWLAFLIIVAIAMVVGFLVGLAKGFLYKVSNPSIVGPIAFVLVMLMVAALLWSYLKTRAERKADREGT
jgi:uncharacterized membrane protein YhaH (DUF805 family)